MQCYTELIPPSGVTNALALPFTSSDASNLIVARTSLLQIFSHKQTNHGQGTRLVLVAEYSLSGTITSLGRVRILNSKSGGEAILVALRDAKLSLIEWDPEKHSIATISIHYYEGEALQRSPFVPDLHDCVNHLTVDPSSRCAIFNFGMTNVAIIPFHQAGDDLVMDDYEAEFDREDAARSPTEKTNGDLGTYQTPYASSFVLPLTALDPGVLHPIHLAFLHEYREPTFGIIYSSIARSSALNYERTDVTQYAVFTLDLEQRASTTLLSISKLPNDLFAVIPLPLPVGGALLVGSNELIHVDQGGKMSAVGVNEFARQCSSFSMADQFECTLRLEGCQLEQLNASNGDMLIVLATGNLAVLSFRLDGRSVSGLAVRILPQELGQTLFRSRASCIASLGSHRLFVGSDVADSVLLSTARKFSQLKKLTSRSGQRASDDATADPAENGEEDGEEEEDDDDLYGDAVDKSMTGQSDGVTTSGTNFRVLDRLHCVAPLRDVTIGRAGKRKRDDDNVEKEGRSATLELIACCGEGLAGGVTIFNRELRHTVVSNTRTPQANGVWSFSVKPSTAISDALDTGRSYDDFMVVSKSTDTGQAESILYKVSDQPLQENTHKDFEPSAGRTIECGSITNGAYIVQVLEVEIKVYDGGKQSISSYQVLAESMLDFGLAQIYLIVDEETGADAKAISASFADPYVLVVKDDYSILLLKTDKKGELSDVDLGPHLVDCKHISACLYSDRQGLFSRQNPQDMPAGTQAVCVMASLSLDGALNIYSLFDLKTRLFYYEGVQFLPSILSDSTPLPRHWKGAEALPELLIADLGEGNDTHPYLIFRTSSGDVAIYNSYSPSPTAFAFRRITLRQTSKAASDDISELGEDGVRKGCRPMKMAYVNGLSVVLVPGQSSAIIAKVTTSNPRAYSLSTGTILAFSGHHSASCSQGFVYIDAHDNLSVARLPTELSIGHSDWVERKVGVGCDVSGIAYLDRTQSYVLAASHQADFQLPQDDEWHTDWKNEDVTCLPQVEQGSVKLLSSTTFNIIDSFRLEYAERPMCIKSMNLEVSEETHERKELVVVGTAITKGEDVVARGCIYIFDVVDVVPQPGIPETDLKLKLIAKEEVKGAVTSLSRIGTQGFMLAAQGQKCMVRGLKEDLSILPVAFMDMKYYVNIAKELSGTGLCILGDAMNGLWFVGYSVSLEKLLYVSY